MLFEHLGMKIDDVSGLLAERHDVDTTGQGLQIGVRTGDFPETIHHIEGRFTAVEEQTLEAGPATGFKVGETRLNTRLQGRKKIIGENPGTKY